MAEGQSSDFFKYDIFSMGNKHKILYLLLEIKKEKNTFFYRNKIQNNISITVKYNRKNIIL